jgi:asparagine synthase (glutamine-hydrolysing)
VTVALSGDGGDENFGGYRRYRWHMNEEKIRSLMPLGIRRPVFGMAGKLYPKADWAPRMFRARTTFQSLARSSVEAYFHSVSVMDDDLRRNLFSDSFRRELQGYQAIEVMHQHAKRAPVQSGLSLIQYLDMKTYLPGDILTKVDRASMAHALEVREPLLDHPMMEWLAGLPEHYKLKGQEGKHILKKSLEPFLSNEILYRSKMGFSIPLAGWFRGPLKTKLRDVVLGPRLSDTGLFNPAFLKRMVEQHQSGLRDYSAPLWTILMFDSFLSNSERSAAKPERAAATV